MTSTTPDQQQAVNRLLDAIPYARLLGVSIAPRDDVAHVPPAEPQLGGRREQHGGNEGGGGPLPPCHRR